MYFGFQLRGVSFEWLWQIFINLINILLTEWSNLYFHWNAEGFTKWWFTCDHSWAWNVPCCFATCCELLFVIVFVVKSYMLKLMQFIIWSVDYLASVNNPLIIFSSAAGRTSQSLWIYQHVYRYSTCVALGSLTNRFNSSICSLVTKQNSPG